MELGQLRILKCVVDQRGFGRGAEAAFVTQSAASQAIRRLERELGARLLTRARPPALTPIGKRVYDHAADVLARDRKAGRDVADLIAGGTGTLVLGASQALSRELLPELVRRFCAREPRATLHLETLPSRELIHVVADGRLELGLGPLQRSMAGFVTQSLGTQRMVLYGGRGLPELGAIRREGSAALAGVALLTSYLDAPDARPGRGHLREHFRTVWEVHSLDLRIHLVAAGLAVGYLPESSVASAGVKRRLVGLTWLPFGAIERNVGLFHAGRRPLGDMARSFLEVARG